MNRHGFQSFSKSWYFETAVVVIPTTWTSFGLPDQSGCISLHVEFHWELWDLLDWQWLASVACISRRTASFLSRSRASSDSHQCPWAVEAQTSESEVCNMQMLCMHRKKICTQDAYLDTRIKLHWGTVLHLLCKHIVRKYEDTIHAVTYVCNYHVIVLYMYVCIYIGTNVNYLLKLTTLNMHVWVSDKITYYPQRTWPKWVVPYRLWRFVWVKIGYRQVGGPLSVVKPFAQIWHPKSTPYYFSLPIILSVSNMIWYYIKYASFWCAFSDGVASDI